MDCETKFEKLIELSYGLEVAGENNNTYRLYNEPDYEEGDSVKFGTKAAVAKATKMFDLSEKVYAVKILDPDLPEDMKEDKRFEREIEVVRSLDHPNIMKILEYGTLDIEGTQTLFHVSEYIDSISLMTLSIPDAAKVVLQVLEALSHAHSRGKVHRDISRENILVDKSMVAVLMDWGLSITNEELGLENMNRLTRPELIMGTPMYISPEGIKTGKKEAPSDIYSIGAVFYEMLADAYPVKEKIPARVAYFISMLEESLKVRDEETEKSKQVSEQLESFLMKIMAIEPSVRYTASWGAQGLKKLIDNNKLLYSDGVIEVKKDRETSAKEKFEQASQVEMPILFSAKPENLIQRAELYEEAGYIFQPAMGETVDRINAFSLALKDYKKAQKRLQNEEARRVACDIHVLERQISDLK
jgi:serine/threonine-protein kinase